MQILSALHAHATNHPDAVALRGVSQVIRYAELDAAVEHLAATLTERGARVVGLFLDNQPAWVIADLACLRAGVALVPIPTFFSEAQRRHAVANAGVDTVLTSHPQLFATPEAPGAPRGAADRVDVLGEPLGYVQIAPARSPDDMAGVAKVTYTSGTTGQPKGVKFTPAALEAVVTSCVGVLGARSGDRFLALVPLSVLMENLLGLYISITVRGEYIAVPMATLGFGGTTQMDAGKALDAIRAFRATNMICTPQVLSNLIAALERGAPAVPELKFVGVGGAPISRHTLERGAALGLPIYQGWGFSEAGTVVTLNTPGHDRIGTAGRALAHARVRRADDGELLVQGPALFAGYVGEPEGPGDWLASGDLGEIDGDGYLSITGRKKTVIINSFGRNISPEWVETELLTRPELMQVVVYGDARPHLVGVVVPSPGVEAAAVARAIERVNHALPDYARLWRWIVADAPFGLANSQLTLIGKPRRDVIHDVYGARLDELHAGAGR